MTRRILTGLMIQAGPQNPLVLYLLNRKCSQFGVTLSWDDSNTLCLRKDDRKMLLAAQHFIYAPTMAEQYDAYFDPLVPKNINDVYVVDYSQPGLLQTYRRSGLQFELASFPEEDDAIEGYFRWYRPKLGDTVFDIGAHCGVSTYFFSRLVGDNGRVIAFEPDPINHKLLLRNVQRHNLINVTCLELAIARSQGTAEFCSEGTIGSTLKRVSGRSTTGHVTLVKTLSLEDAFHNWGVPAFCKIDIEGAEIEVLSAAANTLRNNPTQYAVDTNHTVNGAFTSQPVEDLFRACGYEALSLKSGFMTTWARPEK